MQPEFEQFAADRSARLNDFDDEIRPLVEKAMERYAQGDSTWYEDVVQGAGVLWSETFEKTSPSGKPGDALTTFLRELTDSLKKTTEPSDPPTEGEINRVVNWVGVYSINSATLFGSRDSGQPVKHWITMHDDHVRSTHRAVDGQTADILGTFDVGGYKLQFPGEPVGPPEIWINCRCLLTATGGPQMGTKTEGFAVKATEGAAPDATDEEPDGDEPDEDASTFVDSENEVPWHGVLVVEGIPTGDSRQFDEGSLTHGTLPLPLSYQRSSGDGHAGSVVIGRIDSIERVGNEMRGTGAFNLNVPEANEVIDGIVFGSHGGVSVDVDSTEFELELPEDVEEGLEALFGGGVRPTQHFTAGRIRGASVVALPAFQEAYVALGLDFEEAARDPQAGVDGAQGEDVDTEYSADEEILEEFDVPAELQEAFAKMLSGLFTDADDMDESYSLIASASFAPGTHDGPGWLKNPRDTQRLRSYWTRGKGAAKIRWGEPGDFNRCRQHLGKYINPAFLAGTCANLHKVAIGIWPGMEDGRRRHHSGDVDLFSIVASGAFEADMVAHEFFEDPKFNAITPITVTDDGHIFGHLAAWGTCHLGIGEKCVMPPSSPTNYSYYTRGLVETDRGAVRTGPLVMWTGHAGTRLSAYQATKHYDDTGSAVADLAVGEDTFGIWFSGKLRDDVSKEDIKVLRASAVSGDWRDPSRMGTPDEMVGLIAVNNPGFPIPRVAFAMDGDKQLSLIASGGLVLPRKNPEMAPLNIGAVSMRITADDLAAVANQTADEMERRAQRRERIAAARDDELIGEADGRREKRIAAAKELDD